MTTIVSKVYVFFLIQLTSHRPHHRHSINKNNNKRTKKKSKTTTINWQRNIDCWLWIEMTLYNILDGDPPTLSFFFFCYINNPKLLNSRPNHQGRKRKWEPFVRKRHRKQKKKNRRQIDYFIIIYFLYNFHRVTYNFYWMSGAGAFSGGDRQTARWRKKKKRTIGQSNEYNARIFNAKQK